MEPIELFAVPQKDFADAPSFRSYLAAHVQAGMVDNALTLVVGLTKRTPQDFLDTLQLRGFKIKRKLGAVHHLEYASTETSFATFVTQETDSGVVVFYTNFRKTEEVPKIKEFLETDEHSYPLFFRPYVMQEVLDQLADQHPETQVIDFTAKRYPGSRSLAKLRPDTTRTFSYWGNDGRETLQELEFNYGVLPTRMIVDVPGHVKLGIDGRGILTYYRGHLKTVLEILGRAVDESARTIRAFEGSRFQVFAFQTAGREFPIVTSTPVQLRLQRTLAFTDVDAIRQGLDDHGYAVVSLAAEEGSLYLDAEVVSKQGQRFRIKANDRSVRMLPEGTPHLGSFMEFYEFVIDSVDPGAELVV